MFNQNKKSHRAIIAILALTALIGITVILSYVYSCPIKQITGINCPTCGITRATISLLQFDFVLAWNYNPLVYLLALYIVLITGQYIAKNLKKVNIIFYVGTFIGIAVIWWIATIF